MTVLMWNTPILSSHIIVAAVISSAHSLLHRAFISHKQPLQNYYHLQSVVLASWTYLLLLPSLLSLLLSPPG